MESFSFIIENNKRKKKTKRREDEGVRRRQERKRCRTRKKSESKNANLNHYGISNLVSTGIAFETNQSRRHCFFPSAWEFWFGCWVIVNSGNDIAHLNIHSNQNAVKMSSPKSNGNSFAYRKFHSTRNRVTSNRIVHIPWIDRKLFDFVSSFWLNLLGNYLVCCHLNWRRKRIWSFWQLRRQTEIDVNCQKVIKTASFPFFNARKRIASRIFIWHETEDLH